MARRQHSISLEFRAARSLYRLGLQQGKRNDANNLAEVYYQFTEGFDTVDLKEANGLFS